MACVCWGLRCRHRYNLQRYSPPGSHTGFLSQQMICCQAYLLKPLCIHARYCRLLQYYLWFAAAYRYAGTESSCSLQVPNFWPSISKVTGDHLPERYIWRLAIAFTTFPRAMDAILYYNFFACRRAQLFERSWWYRWLNRLNMTFLIVELLLFYTVTLISSKENFSEYWTVLLQYLHKYNFDSYSTSTHPFTAHEKRLYRLVLILPASVLDGRMATEGSPLVSV